MLIPLPHVGLLPQVEYVPEPLLRGIKPFAPTCLLWLFPLEYQRAVQLQNQRAEAGDRSILGTLRGIRMQAFLVNTAKFLTTLFLVVFQGAIWIRAYAVFSIPFRLVDALDSIEHLHVDTSTLQEIWSAIAGVCGSQVAEQASSAVAQAVEEVSDAASNAASAVTGAGGGEMTTWTLIGRGGR